MKSINKLYIIRHPETEWNKKRRLQGHKDSSLTIKGKNTAKKMGLELKDKNIEKIYSSDLGRCIQTSEIISRILKVKIVKSKELRERNFGDFNGLPDKIVNQKMDRNRFNLKCPNGESFNNMKKRVLKFLKNLPKNKNLLIVTHDGCVRAILSEIYDLNPLDKKASIKQNQIVELNN
ncbi:hypothetical protein COU54_03725 [Candidatus Pacearchaeota archaeon CG10_big_fil_rev_8_21_14_0_10_31_24]|nr:MAG: hypothetical protein COU54_03725 [Candidatus Pacearchaeota archaeon CG10_big_fil_rev_8_21_14_0_10_31_24]